MHRSTRGLMLVRLLVIIAVAALIAAIALPTLIDLADEDAKAHDASNLQNLMRQYLAGVSGTPMRPSPASEHAAGWRFWLALYVGDGDDGRMGVDSSVDSVDPNARITFIQHRNWTLLHSPVDPYRPDEATALKRLEQAVLSGKGSAADGPADGSWTSYAGPRGGRISRRMDVAGATGSRGGIGFFADGFNLLDTDSSVEFEHYSMLEDAWDDWPREATAPAWDHPLLADVMNVDEGSGPLDPPVEPTMAAFVAKRDGTGGGDGETAATDGENATVTGDDGSATPDAAPGNSTASEATEPAEPAEQEVAEGGGFLPIIVGLFVLVAVAIAVWLVRRR
jgi:type II secretory pathway pseudopilin PulG